MSLLLTGFKNVSRYKYIWHFDNESPDCPAAQGFNIKIFPFCSTKSKYANGQGHQKHV